MIIVGLHGCFIIKVSEKIVNGNAIINNQINEN